LESKISAVVFDRNSAAIGQGNGLEDGVFWLSFWSYEGGMFMK
jgi:hypothetical protein